MINKKNINSLDQRIQEITREIMRLEEEFCSNGLNPINRNGEISRVISERLAQKRKLIRENEREGYNFCHECDLFYEESNLKYKNNEDYEEYLCPCEHLIKAKLLI